MANSSKDENGVSTAIGALDSNGTTPKRLYVNPTSGALKVDDNTTGTYPGGHVALKDDNDISSMMGVSSSDAKTPLKVLINSTNELLIKST